MNDVTNQVLFGAAILAMVISAIWFVIAMRKNDSTALILLKKKHDKSVLGESHYVYTDKGDFRIKSDEWEKLSVKERVPLSNLKSWEI